MVLDFLVQLSYLCLWCVYPFILIIQSAGLLPVNNHPEDTPPNLLNTTFDYISFLWPVRLFLVLVRLLMSGSESVECL